MNASELLDRARAGEPLPAHLAENPRHDAEPGEKAAFWTNVYNALVIAGVRREGLTGDLRAQRGFFHRTAITVADLRWSLHQIEHGILRCNRPAPWTFWRPLRTADPRLPYVLPAFDARIHFALNCGARSCPPIRAYTAAGWGAELEIAARSYFSSEVSVDTDGAVRLPYLLRLYSRDFPDPRAFAIYYAPDDAATKLLAGAPIRWAAYDWTLTG